MFYKPILFTKYGSLLKNNVEKGLILPIHLTHMIKFFRLPTLLVGLVYAFTCLQLHAQDSGYKLRPLDTLEVRVFQEPDMTTVYKIGNNGVIILPLLNAVKVGGLTLQEAQQKIKELYEKDYLVNADVTIYIMQYAEQRVYVTGQVNKPGPVIIPGEETMTLSNAIAAAGGTTRLANTRSITVKRKLADGTSKTFDVDLRAILNDKNTHDFNLYDGDTVDVPEAIF